MVIFFKASCNTQLCYTFVMLYFIYLLCLRPISTRKGYLWPDICDASKDLKNKMLYINDYIWHIVQTLVGCPNTFVRRMLMSSLSFYLETRSLVYVEMLSKSSWNRIRNNFVVVSNQVKSFEKQYLGDSFTLEQCRTINVPRKKIKYLVAAHILSSNCPTL